MRKFNAPLHLGTPQRGGASPAPAILSGNGTPALSRRALLLGAAACVAGAAAETPQRLEAGPAGYNGRSPGPILRGRAGESMRVELVNRRDAPTALRLPDGAGVFPGLTGNAVAPGEARAFAFTPESGTFDLYEALAPAEAGLFGAIVVEAAAPAPADLDAIVIFSGERASRVNGGAAPLKLNAPPGARVRLRLANAAPDAVLALRAQGAALSIIAIDGRPSEKFSPAGGAFPLTPGSRIELLLDLGGPFALVSPEGPALTISPLGAPVKARPEIAALPADPRLPQSIALERALRPRLVIVGDGAIEGARGADWPGKPLFKVRGGAPIVLTIDNRTPAPQTLRLEGHAARVLFGLDDGWAPYWRDTLHVEPGRTLRAAFVAGRAGKWPLASVSAEKRARGLRTWFETT